MARTNTAGNTHPGSLAALVSTLGGSFYERSEAIGALVAAIVAGQHAIMLGPPGTAKSDLARSLANATGLRYWETLLTRFSTPEDVFGPVKLSALQRDTFERATDGTMVAAEVAFVDECFKANAAILNSLLTLLNERVFHNGPTSRLACPLVSCIGASNELPESAEELGALWDRFLVRIHVGYLSERASFDGLMFGTRAPMPRVAIDIRAEQAAASAVTMGANVGDAYWAVREACKRDGIAVSDRRWRQSLSLVRATAHLDGRTIADADDLGCLENVLWSAPDERAAIAKLVQGIVNPNAARAVQYLDDARATIEALPEVGATTKADLAAKCADANATLDEITAKLATLGSGRKIDAARAEVAKLSGNVRQRAAQAMGIKL